MSVHAPGSRRYNAVWRWHFYAGLICVPFVIWLALTGTIYLWRPQVEAWLDRPFDHLASAGPVASADAQVAAALRAVPGSHLDRYVLPEHPDQATRVLVMGAGVDRRVYVDPRSLAVLHVAVEDQRFEPVVSRLHGQLLAGDVGSYVVEIAACWAVVMLLTGLYLWWPRGRRGLAGVLYPRLRGGKRVFWRDIHAVAGVWVSVFALGLILTGLPWAKGWIDRLVGYGIAVHEGALFGIGNQVLGTATALLLVVLAVSGTVLWWRRRPDGLLGAPLPLSRPRFGAGLVAAIVALAICMPLFGLTLLLVLLIEAAALRHSPRTRRWLGLAGVSAG